MRSAGLAALLVTALALAGLAAPAALAQPAPADPPAARVQTVSSGAIYPAMLYPQFMVGDLTWDGCSPLYLPPHAARGCPMLRGEPVWAEIGVHWEGPGFLTLYPRGEQWISAYLEDASGERTPLVTTSRVLRTGDSDDRSDGAVAVNAGDHLAFRVDLSGVARTAAAGAHTICYSLEFLSEPAIPPEDARPGCYSFTLYEIESRAFEVERLRRHAIDLLSQYRCDEAAPVIERLLKVHPTSAAGFRLRGIIAELQRRNADAAADYARAVTLIRTHGDRLMNPHGVDWERSARDLDSWRESVAFFAEFAPDVSLLGPVDEGPACRSAQP